MQWQIPDLLKWFVIAASSFTIILSLYEFVIRRFNLMRFLFGMKVLPKIEMQPALAQTQSAK